MPNQRLRLCRGDHGYHLRFTYRTPVGLAIHPAGTTGSLFFVNPTLAVLEHAGGFPQSSEPAAAAPAMPAARSVPAPDDPAARLRPPLPFKPPG